MEFFRGDRARIFVSSSNSRLLEGLVLQGFLHSRWRVGRGFGEFAQIGNLSKSFHTPAKVFRMRQAWWMEYLVLWQSATFTTKTSKCKRLVKYSPKTGWKKGNAKWTNHIYVSFFSVDKMLISIYPQTKIFHNMSPNCTFLSYIFGLNLKNQIGWRTQRDIFIPESQSVQYWCKKEGFITRVW